MPVSGTLAPNRATCAARPSAFKVYADCFDFIPRKTAGRVLNCDELLRATKPPRVARLPKASPEHADEDKSSVGRRPATGLGSALKHSPLESPSSSWTAGKGHKFPLREDRPWRRLLLELDQRS